MNECINQSVTSHKKMRWTTDIEKSVHAHQPNPWVHSTFHTKSLTSKNHKNIWKKSQMNTCPSPRALSLEKTESCVHQPFPHPHWPHLTKGKSAPFTRRLSVRNRPLAFLFHQAFSENTSDRLWSLLKAQKHHRREKRTRKDIGVRITDKRITG